MIEDNIDGTAGGTPLALKMFYLSTQGSSCVATLGFGTEVVLVYGRKHPEF